MADCGTIKVLSSDLPDSVLIAQSTLLAVLYIQKLYPGRSQIAAKLSFGLQSFPLIKRMSVKPLYVLIYKCVTLRVCVCKYVFG